VGRFFYPQTKNIMSLKTKQSISFLLFSATTEILLSQYENIYLLNQYDPALHTKLKNLKANFERVSRKAYQIFDEEEQLVFFNLINILESLLNSAESEEDFSELLGLIKAWKAKEVTIINTNEELVKVAEGLTL
jgi:hypothetical protein